MIVADANVVVGLVLPGSDAEVLERLQHQEPEWVSPPLLLSELRSVFSRLVRGRRQSALQAHALFELALEAVDDCSIEPDTRDVFDLVEQSGCSSYDCEYVAVARGLGCRLVTLDAEVLRAFPAIAIAPQDVAGSG